MDETNGRLPDRDVTPRIDPVPERRVHTARDIGFDRHAFGKSRVRGVVGVPPVRDPVDIDVERPSGAAWQVVLVEAQV